nr:hypothetical protein Iba_chr10dCG6340 [Ipomoea batatas]
MTISSYSYGRQSKGIRKGPRWSHGYVEPSPYGCLIVPKSDLHSRNRYSLRVRPDVIIAKGLHKPGGISPQSLGPFRDCGICETHSVNPMRELTVWPLRIEMKFVADRTHILKKPAFLATVASPTLYFDNCLQVLLLQSLENREGGVAAQESGVSGTGEIPFGRNPLVANSGSRTCESTHQYE